MKFIFTFPVMWVNKVCGTGVLATLHIFTIGRYRTWKWQSDTYLLLSASGPNFFEEKQLPPPQTAMWTCSTTFLSKIFYGASLSSKRITRLSNLLSVSVNINTSKWLFSDYDLSVYLIQYNKNTNTRCESFWFASTNLRSRNLWLGSSEN